MKVGTKTLLFGLHQFFIHSALMLIAYLKLYRKLPSLMEAVGIIVHDWGYFGKSDCDGEEGFYHPYLGAEICRFFFGEEGWRFCLGHNDEVCAKEGLQRSKLYACDKYYYIVLPIWLHNLLGTMSGEHMEIIADPKRSWDPRGYKENMARRFLTGEIAI